MYDETVWCGVAPAVFAGLAPGRRRSDRRADVGGDDDEPGAAANPHRGSPLTPRTGEGTRGERDVRDVLRDGEWFPGASALAALGGASGSWVAGYRRGWLIAEGDEEGWMDYDGGDGAIQPDLYAAVNRADFWRGVSRGFRDCGQETEK